MAFAGERNEKNATHKPNARRQNRQKLLRLRRRRRVQTVHDVLVQQRRGGENKDGVDGVEEIQHRYSPFGRLVGGNRGGGRQVEDEESPERGEGVTDFSPLVPEAVGETEDEAGRGASGEERHRQGLADGGRASAFAAEDGGENLECQNCPRREEVRQVGRPFEGFSHRLLRRRFLRLLICFFIVLLLL
ncbi:unnamed protein product [Cuscuta campestris]|uniref:Uncharacterized protein n=1 Tax=Cuscuta campestris TaxID=132261 RepID=A0A484M656_9ASTE|nr:unnamed protein product [Cuscuta campestris]